MAKKLKVEFNYNGQLIVSEMLAIGRDKNKQRICQVKIAGKDVFIPATDVHVHKPSKHLVRALELRDEINKISTQTRNAGRIANQTLPKHKQAQFDKLFEQGQKKLKTLSNELDELFTKKLSEPEVILLTV